MDFIFSIKNHYFEKGTPWIELDKIKQRRERMYYVSVQLKDGGFDYVCAPKGSRWTEAGVVKDEGNKGGPEMSRDPYKRYFFRSHTSAKRQANLIVGGKVVPSC